MRTYRVPVLVVNSGYCEEEAETEAEVVDMIERGDYSDIYGESLVSVDVDDSRPITFIDEDGDEIPLDEDDLALLDSDPDELALLEDDED